jgi:phosphatidylglycerol:prolipoprotein diacylglycerol transferase
MLPILNLGPLAIPVPELLILAGVWFGLSLAEKHAPRRPFPTETLYNLVSVMLLSGVLAARAVYALRHPSAFAASPASLLSLNPGLLDGGGGVVGGLLAGWIFGQRKGLTLWPTLDALAPLLGVMLVAVPLANLASGDAYGAETSLPWAITLWGAARHPVQVYEAVAAGLILARLFPGPRMASRPTGQDFLLLAAWSAGARLFLEAFRGESLTTLGGVRVAQLAAWLALAAALALLGRMRPAPQEAG